MNLHFSAQKAKDIGLEQAILMSVIEDIKRFGNYDQECLIEIKHLAKLLPFLSENKLVDLLDSLQNQGLFSYHETSPGEFQLTFSVSFNNKTQRENVTELNHENSKVRSRSFSNGIRPRAKAMHFNNDARQINQNGLPIYQQAQLSGSNMTEDWQPSDQFWAQLTHKNITQEFVTEQLAVFRVKHQGRTRTTNLWDADLMDFVVRKWQYAQNKQGSIKANNESAAQKPASKGNYDINNLDF